MHAIAMSAVICLLALSPCREGSRVRDPNRDGDPEEDFQDAQDALEELAEQEEEEEELEEVTRGSGRETYYCNS